MVGVGVAVLVGAVVPLLAPLEGVCVSVGRTVGVAACVPAGATLVSVTAGWLMTGAVVDGAVDGAFAEGGVAGVEAVAPGLASDVAAGVSLAERAVGVATACIVGPAAVTGDAPGVVVPIVLVAVVAVDGEPLVAAVAGAAASGEPTTAPVTGRTGASALLSEPPGAVPSAVGLAARPG